MGLKRTIPFILVTIILLSCWDFGKQPGNDYNPVPSVQVKVWGYKPIYGPEDAAKVINYTSGARPVTNAGNIYAFGNYIFQVELGKGIHVIDNTIPSSAARIGFININGCAEISIKNNKLYTNSYDDLVVLDFSDLNNIHEYSRVKGIFSEYRYDSPLAQPPSRGYYTCPNSNNFVTGWEQDSIYQACYKL